MSEFPDVILGQPHVAAHNAERSRIRALFELTTEGRLGPDKVPTKTAFYPEHFGAVGDGVTDDTEAIQSAIDAASAAGGGIVMLSPKIYAAAGLILKSGAVLSSVGIGIKWAGGKRTATIQPPSGWSGGWVIDSPSTNIVNSGVIGILINGQVANASSPNTGGIRIKSGTWCTIDSCSVANTSLGSVTVSGTACIIRGNGMQNFWQFRNPLTVDEGVLAVYGTDHWVENNQINGGHGVSDPLSSSDPDQLHQCGVLAVVLSSWFLGGNAEFSEVGWKIASFASVFTGIRADTNPGIGMIVNGGAGGGNQFYQTVWMANCSAPNADGVLSQVYVRDGSCIFDGMVFTSRPGWTTRPRYALVEDLNTTGWTASDFRELSNKYQNLRFFAGGWKWDFAWRYGNIPFSFEGDRFMSGDLSILSPARFSAGRTYADQNSRFLVSNGRNWIVVGGTSIGANLLDPRVAFHIDGSINWSPVVSSSDSLTLVEIPKFKRHLTLRWNTTSTGVTNGFSAVQAINASIFAPVVAGQQYKALALIRGVPGKASTAALQVNWFTSDNAFISNSLAASSVTIDSEEPTLVSGMVTAPANAAKATLSVYGAATGLAVGDQFAAGSFTLLLGNTSTDVVEV